jgi:hypothetical protein
MYSTNWLQWGDNAYWTSEALSDIEDIFADQKVYHWYMGYWVCVGQVYGEVNNWGSSTTPGLVTYMIDHDISYHSYCFATLYIGHGYADGFYGHSEDPEDPEEYPNFVSYDYIEDHAQYSPDHRFVFMWVCKGNWNSFNAWNPLYESNPSTYGPAAWIGFEGASPWLTDSMNEDNLYKYWLVFFYYYALNYNGYTIMEALDYASSETGYYNFADCDPLSSYYETYWPYNASDPDPWKDGIMRYDGDTDMCMPHTLAIY